MSSDGYDYLLKVIVVGDGAVGKTAISVRFTEDKFKDDYKMTIGVDFSIKTMEVANKRIKIQIWDTGGQEQFSYVRPLYYKGSMGGFIVFDVTNRQSFYNVGKWFKEVYDNTGQIPIILVGNKIDLPDIQVTKQEAQKMAQQYNTLYFTTSAKSGASVNLVFDTLVKMIMDPKYVDSLNTAEIEYEKPKAIQSEAYQKYNALSKKAVAYFQAGNKVETLNTLKEAFEWANKASFEEGIRWCEDQIEYVSKLLDIPITTKKAGIVLTCQNCNTFYKVEKEGKYSCPKCSSFLTKVSLNYLKS